MPKRNQTKRTEIGLEPQPESSVRSSATASRYHSMTRWQVILSIFIVFHFGSWFVAVSSNQFQSLLQQRLIGWLSPYLVTTSQVYGALPLEWTHAQVYDFPIHIEAQGKGTGPWEQISFQGLSKDELSNSRWSNFARILRLVAEEDPESEILAEIALTIAQRIEAQRGHAGRNSLSAIRFVQPYVPSFDESLVIAEGQEDLLDTDVEVIYAARIVRSDGNVIGILPIQESYRSSKAVSTEDTPAHPTEIPTVSP